MKWGAYKALDWLEWWMRLPLLGNPSVLISRWKRILGSDDKKHNDEEANKDYKAEAIAKMLLIKANQ